MNLLARQFGREMAFATDSHSVALPVSGVVEMGANIKMLVSDTFRVSAHDVPDNESFRNGPVVLDSHQTGDQLDVGADLQDRTLPFFAAVSAAVCAEPFDATVWPARLGTVVSDPLGNRGATAPITSRGDDIRLLDRTGLFNGSTAGRAFEGAEDLSQTFVPNVSTVIGGDAFECGSTRIANQSDHCVTCGLTAPKTSFGAIELGSVWLSPKSFGVIPGAAKERCLTV